MRRRVESQEQAIARAVREYDRRKWESHELHEILVEVERLLGLVAQLERRERAIRRNRRRRESAMERRLGIR